MALQATDHSHDRDEGFTVEQRDETPRLFMSQGYPLYVSSCVPDLSERVRENWVSTTVSGILD